MKRIPLLAVVAMCAASISAQPTDKGATKTPEKPYLYARDKSTDVCTTAPPSEWLPADEMKLLAQHRGYRIKTFKIAKGNCYEIYGFNRENQVVEAYFDPVTSRLIRMNIAK